MKSAEHIFEAIRELRDLLGIAFNQDSSEARRWVDAASERWGQVRDQSSDGLSKAKELGSATGQKALSVKASLTGKLANRRNKKGSPDSKPDESD